MEPLPNAQSPAQSPLQIPCPFCSTPVDGTAFFCSVCGKSLKNATLSTGFFAQIGLYLVSVLLPPLFLGRTMKYLKSTDQKAKQIGMISLGLTIVALVGAVWFSITFTKSLTRGINQQLNQYGDIGL